MNTSMTRAMGAQPPERDVSSSSAGAETEEDEPSFVRNLGIFFLFVFLIVPVIVLAVAALFGLLLAELEGWSFPDGFYYIISMLCGLPNPLTDVDPDTTEGRIIDIVIAIWALGARGHHHRHRRRHVRHRKPHRVRGEARTAKDEKGCR